MKVNRIRVFFGGVAIAVMLGVYAQRSYSETPRDPVAAAMERGLKWLVSVQGADGGWGQDGGETSYARVGERLESNGNDVANTAVAAEALVRAGNTPKSGPYREALQRAVNFILKNVEQSPADGLTVTRVQGTQIQRKLGPYIDTFLTSKLLAELDGAMGDAASNARVRQSLQKCVAKIEANQLKDGSWNIAGGWAPVLGTSMASQSLETARSKGVAVKEGTIAGVRSYTMSAAVSPAARPEAAGVALYQGAQQLEQLSRTAKDREANARQIGAIKAQLSDAKFVTGFGSIGGEEFFSYLSIGDSLRRTGGAEWKKWSSDMTAKILQMQNADGTWAGHHCITGRVAVTSAAILNLAADAEPGSLIQRTSRK